MDKIRNLKVMKMHSNAIIPTRVYDDDLTFDLYTCGEVTLLPNEIKIIDTGIAIEQPEGWGIDVRPRSSTMLEWKQIMQLGTIDQYRDSIKIIAMYTGLGCKIVPHGTRLAQLMPVWVGKWNLSLVCELSPSKRGKKGLGSSGK